MVITPFEMKKQLLFALARQVRVLTISMLYRLFGLSADGTERLMAGLIRERLVERRIVRAKVIGPLSGPLAKGRPGGPTPHAGRISYQAKKRFKALRVQTVIAYFGSAKLLDFYGTAPRVPFKPEQVSHDIGVSEMWLYMLKRFDRLTAHCFEGEDCYAAEAEKFEKLPDARIVHRRTRAPLLMLEFAGAYRTDRVRDFQEDMHERGLPYWMF